MTDDSWTVVADVIEKVFLHSAANLSKLRHTVVTADVNLHDYGLCIQHES